jgi:hypothetical protein
MSTDSFQNGRSKAEAELSTKFANAGVRVENASMAQDARKYDPFGVGLPSAKAAEYWRKSNFVDGKGDVIRASSVDVKSGIVYVSFPDGSTLSFG